MNKTRIILAATGGVIALAVLTTAALTWLAFSDRTAAFEGDDDNVGLEQAVSKVSDLLGKKPYPSAENRKRLDENRQAVEQWCASARKEAAKGDWMADAACTPAQFKEQLAKDVKALATLVGAEGTPVVAADFAYGSFKDYLADKMPSKDQLPRLQRQWFDLTSLVDLLATNGVAQVVDLQIVDRSAEQAKKAAAEKAGKKNKKAAKKPAKAETGARQPSVETYRLSFRAKPAALVEILRALSFQERFTVVDGFGFVRERDAIVEALGGGEKKADAPAATGRRGRRRGAAAAPAAEAASGEDVKKNPTVFDPDRDSTVKAELTVSVYDFRSLEEDGEGAGAASPEKKGESK